MKDAMNKPSTKTEAPMNYSPSYRAKKLGEIQARLREVRYDLGRLLETASCSEIRSLDEVILSLEDLRHMAEARVADQSPPPWTPHKLDGGRS
jgi:hypothetical protein